MAYQSIWYFSDLPEEFHHKQGWTSFDNPKLIHYNAQLAEDLGFPEDMNPEDLVPYINGNEVLEGSEPLALSLIHI